MAEQERNKAGLQKKVSSVFDGVPVPSTSGAQQPSGAPAPDRTANTPPKPVSPDRQSTQSSLIKKLQQTEDSLEKAAPVKQPESKQFVGEKAAPAKQPEDKPFVETTSIETTGPSFLQQIKDKLFTPKPGVSATRQKAMVVLVPVLAIAMIFVLRQVLSTAPRKTEGATENNTPVVTADSDSEIDWQIPEPLPVAMRDPIKLPDQSNTQNEEQNGTTGETKTVIISVKDIVYSEDKPSAVIDGQIVHIGDKVHGATVIKIDRDGVELERDGERWEEKIHE
ncbi:MAG: hypothetical protein ACYTFW_01150 [Planctomycetota bacterium]|jgi:hypothetical protein